MTDASKRIRSEPPPFRTVRIASMEQPTPRLARIMLSGPELSGLEVDEPAASVRLLVPTPGDDALEIPEWKGNEFLRQDGTRPIIRTFTPRRLDGDVLTLEIVLHGHGAVSNWVRTASPGDPAAISGTGRGYAVDQDAPAFLLAGDESAMPAIGQLLEHLPVEATVDVIIEIAEPSARLELPEHPRASVRWVDAVAGSAPGESLVEAVQAVDIAAEAKVWVAGEAAAMFRIRKHLFDERGLDRRQATVRGYWKHGRSGSDA